MDYDTGALLASGAFLYASLTFLTRNIHRIVPLPVAPSDTSWWTHRTTNTSRLRNSEAGATSSNPSDPTGNASAYRSEPSISVRYQDGRRVPAEDQIPLSVLETLIQSPVYDIRQAAEAILARRYALHPYTRRNLKQALLRDEPYGEVADDANIRAESGSVAHQARSVTIDRPTLQALEASSPVPSGPTDPNNIVDLSTSHNTPPLSPTALPEDHLEIHEGALLELQTSHAQSASQAAAAISPPAARLSLDESPRSLAISVILQLPSHLRSQLQILAGSSPSVSQQQQQGHQLQPNHSPAERRLRFEELEQRGEIARAARRGHHGWTQDQ